MICDWIRHESLICKRQPNDVKSKTSKPNETKRKEGGKKAPKRKTRDRKRKEKGESIFKEMEWMKWNKAITGHITISMIHLVHSCMPLDDFKNKQSKIEIEDKIETGKILLQYVCAQSIAFRWLNWLRKHTEHCTHRIGKEVYRILYAKMPVSNVNHQKEPFAP